MAVGGGYWAVQINETARNVQRLIHNQAAMASQDLAIGRNGRSETCKSESGRGTCTPLQV